MTDRDADNAHDCKASAKQQSHAANDRTVYKASFVEDDKSPAFEEESDYSTKGVSSDVVLPHESPVCQNPGEDIKSPKDSWGIDQGCIAPGFDVSIWEEVVSQVKRRSDDWRSKSDTSATSKTRIMAWIADVAEATKPSNNKPLVVDDPGEDISPICPLGPLSG
eukprot:jgi/Hompol1/5504/HPOL_001949-RA